MNKQIIGIDIGATTSRVAHFRNYCSKIISTAPGIIDERYNNKLSPKKMLLSADPSGIPLMARHFCDLKTAARIRDHADVIISVPTLPTLTKFQLQENLTRAAKIAGLEVAHYITDTHAAAVYYTYATRYTPETGTRNILVYALGETNFQSAVYTVEEIDSKQLLSSNIDMNVSGSAFDATLLVSMSASIRKITGKSLDTNMPHIRQEASRVKQALSTEFKVASHLDIYDFHPPLTVEISRDEFEQITQHLIDRSITRCEEVLSEAGMDPSEIDAVIPVGAHTQMPAIASAVENLLGKSFYPTDPATVVAFGSSVYAATGYQMLLKIRAQTYPQILPISEEAPNAVAFGGTLFREG